MVSSNVVGEGAPERSGGNPQAPLAGAPSRPECYALRQSNHKEEMQMDSQQFQAFACGSKGKTGIISIDRFSGVDAVCLYALSDFDPAIEHGDVLELGSFLNRYLAAARRASAECCSNAADGLGVHSEAPIDWHLANFARYVKEHDIPQDELRMMIEVAIGARAIFGERHNV